jgi:hypothetical protein
MCCYCGNHEERMGMTNVDYSTVFEDPPVSTAPRRGVWMERLEPVTKKPGVFARVAYGPWSKVAGLKYSLDHGRMKIPPGRWEFELRKIGDEGGVWAKYLGPDVSPDAE